MNAALLGLSKAEIDARFDDIVEFSEIGAFIQQPVKTYSSGMPDAFSVAVHLEPDVLVIDEALAVGDERFQRKCFGMIESPPQCGQDDFVRFPLGRHGGGAV